VGLSKFSIIIGGLIGLVGQSNLDIIMSMGMTLHVVVAMLLIGAGIYTQKKWSCGHDVSRRTFLFISVPCPVCLTALFVSCMILASTLGWSGIKIGIFVGSIFFIMVLCSTWIFRKMHRTPEDLGAVMMFLGIFYLLGSMLVPAYIKAKQLSMVSTGGEVDIVPLLVLCGLIICGYVIGNRRSV
jgi:predicted transporter